MKFYLLIFLIFLSALSLPNFSFGQENATNSQSLTPEHPSATDSPPDEYSLDHQLRKDLDDGEISGSWPNHIERESDTFQAKFFNMLLILGLLIGFMILASWALKRMMKTKMSQLNTASTIKVLETRYLSPRATLYLIEIEDRTFLIAESPTNTTYLANFPSKIEE